MRNEFRAVIEHDGDWYIGYCPEIAGANGQGRTVEACRTKLSALPFPKPPKSKLGDIPRPFAWEEKLFAAFGVALTSGRPSTKAGPHLDPPMGLRYRGT